jgi:hypothetical protein
MLEKQKALSYNERYSNAASKQQESKGQGKPVMARIKLSKGKSVLMGLVVAVLSAFLGAFASATPAHAANIQLSWVNATTINISGNVLRNNGDFTGSFATNVAGTPPGSSTFVAGPGLTTLSFNCTSTVTVIIPQIGGTYDYSKATVNFSHNTGVPPPIPETCSRDILSQNIIGLAQSPIGGANNVALILIPIANIENRSKPGGGGGNDSTEKQRSVPQ